MAAFVVDPVSHVPEEPVSESVRHALVVLQVPVPPAAGLAAMSAPFQKYEVWAFKDPI
jgi:hypothetical protein